MTGIKRGNPHLAAGVGAASPVDADLLREVQLLLQLCHHRHRPILCLDHRKPAELQHARYTQILRKLDLNGRDALEKRAVLERQLLPCQV